MTKLSHTQIIRIVALVLLIFLLVYPLLTQKDTTVTISSFQECVDAGYPVMESYPRQCNTPDWQNFVEDVGLIEEEPLQEEEDSEAVFCTMDAKECPDGSYVGRQWPNCEFAPCPGEE